MKLSEKYRPKNLSEIVGQSIPHSILFGWMQSPYSSCWMFRGSPGVGKTSSALAMAEEMGCKDSYRLVPCSDLGVDKARELIRSLALSPLFGSGKWNILILEELERLSPACQQYLKVALESLPSRAVVFATSNDTGIIDPALLQRFTVLDFEAGNDFARSANLRIAQLWAEETGGEDPPREFERWGFSDSREFSMRLALDRMQQQLLMRRANPSPASGSASPARVVDSGSSPLNPMEALRRKRLQQRQEVAK